MDLTQDMGDGKNYFENDKVTKRRIQNLNLQSIEMNKAMSEIGAKKIGFLRSVNTNTIDSKKLDLVESLKIKTVNEFNEGILNSKTNFMQDGRMHEAPQIVFQHQQKITQARKELNNMQSTFNSVLANPSYDNQI